MLTRVRTLKSGKEWVGYYYDGRVNRCLCVDGRAILEALGKVYDARNLVNEIRGQ